MYQQSQKFAALQSQVMIRFNVGSTIRFPCRAREHAWTILQLQSVISVSHFLQSLVSSKQAQPNAKALPPHTEVYQPHKAAWTRSAFILLNQLV